MLELESEEWAQFLLRAQRSPETTSAVDSLRWNRYLNLRANLMEAVYTNALHGTMELGMAPEWLDDVGYFSWEFSTREWWASSRTRPWTAR